MPAPNFIFRLLALILLLLLPASIAQPPRPNGKDGIFLVPLDPAPILKFVPTAPPTEGTPTPSVAASTSPPTTDVTPSESPDVEDLPNTRRVTNLTYEPFPQADAVSVQVLDRAQQKKCKKLSCRNLNGECTGVKNPEWGKIQLAQFSYLEEQTSLIPGGQGLSSARVISNLLSDQKTDIPNSHGLNDLFVFFGQFIDHNLVATPAGDAQWKIPNPDGPDLEFTRSTRAMIDGKERPLNTLTSTLDLVAVYGPTELRNRDLIEYDKNGKQTGKLKTSGNNLLPRNSGSSPVYNAPTASRTFFIAGDHRVNEHPALTSLHIIFLREHNRLCDKIKANIPYLSGEQIYELARKLNIAQFQKIVYEEFYPAIISKRLSKYRGLKKKVNPTVSDVFAGAAFRVGHTMVSSIVARRSATGPLPPFDMKNIFFRNAEDFSSEEVDNVIRGVSKNTAQEVDLKVHDLLRNMLFEGVATEEGFDLVALNIQRGRDHNLPSFNTIRTKICGLRPARAFYEISSNPKTASDLAAAYPTVYDVEAWPGLVAEDHARGSGLGETMICLWRLEFTRLRDGDQFFYRRKKKIPRILRKKCRDVVAAILNKNRRLLREIIVRNTGITDDQLPSGNIFKT